MYIVQAIDFDQAETLRIRYLSKSTGDNFVNHIKEIKQFKNKFEAIAQIKLEQAVDKQGEDTYEYNIVQLPISGELNVENDIIY